MGIPQKLQIIRQITLIVNALTNGIFLNPSSTVLYIMTRAVSMMTILAMVFDSYLLRKDVAYYKKTFHTRDCIPLTGTCWVVGFTIAIWPFQSSTRWQCYVYHALTSPVVFPLQKTLWASIDTTWGFVWDTQLKHTLYIISTLNKYFNEYHNQTFACCYRSCQYQLLHFQSSFLTSRNAGTGSYVQ